MNRVALASGKSRRRLAGSVCVVIAAAGVLAGLWAAPAAAQSGGTALPESARLDGVRHIYQTWNNCGPANLTMAMSYYGWGYGQQVAANFLKPNPEDKNVSPGQMAAFVNQQTELPIRAIWRYGGTVELIKRFLAAGFPVVVESGYDVEDLGWMGHYETVVAYDDPSQTIWVYDSYLGIGSGYGRTYSYDEFDSWWRHFNRAYILIFPLDREQDVRDILGPHVDPLYAAEQALAVARQEAAQDQTDGWAWFNAGTSATKLKRYHDAAIYYDEAFRQGLPYRLLWYEFGPFEAYYHVGRYDDVLTLVTNTEATTIYVEETSYWQGMVFAARGESQNAIAQFDEALSFNRNFVEAQQAKEQVQSGAFVPPA